MLRITVQDSPEQVTLKLEGQLIGAWITDLGNFCRTANSTLSGRLLCLDLNAVDHVDRAGKPQVGKINHYLRELLAQRVFSIAFGYPRRTATIVLQRTLRQPVLPAGDALCEFQ